MSKNKKQFCVHGHDTFICGRNKRGACKICRSIARKKIYVPHPRAKVQFCLKGHDTFICGRASNGHCRECERIKCLEYYYANKEQQLASQKTWKENNKEAYNEYHRNYYQNNPQHKLAGRIRDRIAHLIKGHIKPASAVEMLGCDIEFLKGYIESKFKEGMSWDNWNKFGWHLDHVTPLNSFDLTDKEQFSKACHYTNLQPMWSQENWSKGNKVLS